MLHPGIFRVDSSSAIENHEKVCKVFISYRHENVAHTKRVRDLADRLEQVGLTVIFDQFAQEREFHGGGPPLRGWPRWGETQAGDPENKILVIESAGYYRCWEGTELHTNGGLGAAGEAQVIAQRLHNAAGFSNDIRVVTFEPIELTKLPLRLQGYHRFTDPNSFVDLVNWLKGTLQPVPTGVAPFEWIPTPQPLFWQMANHDNVRAAVQKLLCRNESKRILILRGEMSTGKTLITNQVLGYALRTPGLACGRLDFRGLAADHDFELHTFVQHLHVDLPSSTSSLPRRLDEILGALNRRRQPTLIILDQYEEVGQAREWVERRLLQAVITAEWLRVIILGRRVPEYHGAIWSKEAVAPITLTQARPEDWRLNVTLCG